MKKLLSLFLIATLFLTSLCAQEKSTITFSEKNILVQGKGVVVSGNTAYIRQSGVYEVSGKSSDGQIFIEAAKDAEVELILNGLDLKATKNAAIFCKSGKDLIITLTKGSKNVLSDLQTYKYEDSKKELPDATIYSDCDIKIQGDGSLTVNANFKHGIASNDDIKINGGTISITSKKDAINADDDLTINGGDFTIRAGDDAIHADRNLTINNGVFNINDCYEGLEGTQIYINGGKISIKARNDAIGAAAGTKETKAFSGYGANPGVAVHIAGGQIEATGEGDVVDSNGDIFVSGGTLYLSSRADPTYEGALLCNGTVHISGGSIASVGNIGVELEVSKQPVLVVSHPKMQKSGSAIELKDKNGKTLLSTKAQKDFRQSIFTSPLLKVGETYSLVIDGNKTGDLKLSSTLTKTADNGGKFTGGYPRGHW